MKHYLGICLVILTFAAVILIGVHMCSTAVDSTATHVAEAFASVLKVQPRVTVNERVVLEQTAPIAEFAVVQKQELVTVGLDENYQLLHVQIPLTEKKLTAEATFEIKAGFDLSEPFDVTVDPRTHAVKAVMPHAKILSVEQMGDVTLHADDEVLNRVSTEDHEQIEKNLLAAAHSAAEDSGLKGEAEEQVTRRLNELLEHDGQSLLINWKKETPSVR